MRALLCYQLAGKSGEGAEHFSSVVFAAYWVQVTFGAVYSV